MGNWQSHPGYVRGDYSGNTGSHNVIGSRIIIGSRNIIGPNNKIYNYGNDGDRDETDKYTEILQHLYPPGSGYKSHRNRVPKPVKGTCTWVTGHPKYKEWLGNESCGLLWLSADPGCGKSVIASFLVRHLETQTDAIVCYFFFKDDSEEQKSATFALRAVLHQLFVQRPNLCSYAEGPFKAKGSRVVEEVDTLWDILVEAVAKGGCGDVICVVDALDECDEMAITPLIRHITSLRESQPAAMPLKFLVTSRPYHRIEIELSSPETTIRLKGEEEFNAITADVTRVIDEGIKKLELHWGQAEGLEYLRGLLMSLADRTFLWVSLVLEILKDSPDDSPEVFTNIVTTAPGDLAQFYTKVLDKSTNPVEARRILNTVVAAARPLTLREMNIAFRIRRDHTMIKDLGHLSLGFEKTVKNLCGLFVRVIDEKIYLVHQTAREFLIKGSSAGQGNWQHTLCSTDANFMVADICIAYLSLEDFENDPLPVGYYSSSISDEIDESDAEGFDSDEENYGPDREGYGPDGEGDGSDDERGESDEEGPESDEEGPEPNEEGAESDGEDRESDVEGDEYNEEVQDYLEEHALLDYAATHWPSHFRDSQDRQMELFKFTRLICKPGSNRFLTWLKVYWRNNHEHDPCPDDFTNLMVASWFGQGVVVERILGEGGDFNVVSKDYGTALNVAALRADHNITRMLLDRNIVAYVGGKEYNIPETKRSEYASDSCGVLHSFQWNF